MDDATRVHLLIKVKRALPAERVLTALDCMARTRRYSRTIVYDNRREFRNDVMEQWAGHHGITQAFIEPDRPSQNAFIESFKRPFRDE